MILTRHFLYKKIKSLAQKALIRAHCYRSLDDVRYILLMCEARDWKAVEPCVETLKAMKKTVHVCVYTRFPRQESMQTVERSVGGYVGRPDEP